MVATYGACCVFKDITKLEERLYDDEEFRESMI